MSIVRGRNRTAVHGKLCGMYACCSWELLCKVDAKPHFLKLSKMNQKPSCRGKHFHTPHILGEKKKKS